MPSYRDTLTLQQWVDLVAYLKSLIGPEVEENMQMEPKDRFTLKQKLIEKKRRQGNDTKKNSGSNLEYNGRCTWLAGKTFGRAAVGIRLGAHVMVPE
jgi:hypothetical protein